MSEGGWKKPFYKVAENDSKNAAWLGNAIGWQGLEDEGNYNAKNPGHAITKAAEYAALYYLGGMLGGASAGAGAEAGAGMGASAGGAIDMAAEQAAEQGLTQAAGATSSVYQPGITDKALGLLSSGSSSGKSGILAKQVGMNMLQGQQQPQQRPMAAPPQQGQQEPLRMPYGSPYGTSAGNSLGIQQPLTEEQKRMLRARGLL